MNPVKNQHAAPNFSNPDRLHTNGPNHHFSSAHKNLDNNQFHKNYNPKNPHSNAISEVHRNQNPHYQDFSRRNYQMYVTLNKHNFKKDS